MTFLILLLVMLQTSASYLHIYKVHFSGKRLMIGGKQLPGLFLASVSLVITEKAPFREKNLVTYGIISELSRPLIGSFKRLICVTCNFFFSVAILCVIAKTCCLDFLMDICSLFLGLERYIFNNFPILSCDNLVAFCNHSSFFFL